MAKKNSELARVKKLFFDRTPVQKMMDRKTLYVLKKYGGLTRKVGQNSMKTKPAGVHSPKGTPPYAHGTKLLKKFYFFVVDMRTKNVVIGPVRLSKYSDLHLPKVLEGGGTINVKHPKTKKITNTANHPPRPYSGPAGMKYRGQVASWYAEAP